MLCFVPDADASAGGSTDGIGDGDGDGDVDGTADSNGDGVVASSQTEASLDGAVSKVDARNSVSER